MNLHRADIIHLADVVLKASGSAFTHYTPENRTKIVDALEAALIKITTTKG